MLSTPQPQIAGLFRAWRGDNPPLGVLWRPKTCEDSHEGHEIVCP